MTDSNHEPDPLEEQYEDARPPAILFPEDGYLWQVSRCVLQKDESNRIVECEALDAIAKGKEFKGRTIAFFFPLNDKVFNCERRILFAYATGLITPDQAREMIRKTKEGDGQADYDHENYEWLIPWDNAVGRQFCALTENDDYSGEMKTKIQGKSTFPPDHPKVRQMGIPVDGAGNDDPFSGPGSEAAREKKAEASAAKTADEF